ncbi:UPF0182 family protein [Pseudonocardia sp. Cha107L01]|uniref:UPF0182 family protein n=1 Tax=Pseudonocardia sp. Cha107L01 TaxID=3457576 RepID=UPI00403ED3CA
MTPPTGAPALSRRTRILLVVGGVALVALLAGSRLLDYYVNWLWFGEVGYRQVFSTIVLTRIVQFVLVAVVFAVLLAATLAVAFRSRPVFVPVSGPEDPVARYRTVIIQRLRVFAIGVPLVIGVIAGLAAQGDWQTAQMFLHSTPFGTADPVFGMDVGFYAFQLPFYRWVLDLMFVAVALCFVASLITHYIFGGVRLAGRAGQVSVAARAQLAVLAGVFVLLKAVAYWLDRYSTLLSSSSDNGGVFSGASYTDLNAVIPAKIILLFISLICAAAFFAAVFRHNLQLPSIAIALLVLSSVLIGAAWPAVLEQFVVRPNANVREAIPIQRNIEATQAAYGLTPQKIKYQDYSGVSNATPSAVRGDTATISNLRLLDPSKLAKTFTQLEQRKNFYGFPPKLDIDRYPVNGNVQDYVVAARELDSSALTGNQTDWINRHMVYTHGNGFVAAPANQVNSALDEAAGSGGYPNFTVSDTSNKGDIVVNQPRIYYGELITDYSIVGSPPTDAPREYDSDTDAVTYTGKGGVSLGNLFNRLVFAMSYGERNILFNGSINADSKILFVRDPSDRVSQVAPWLTLDGDPYPAVVDGRIQWIVDGYTTLENYPYAEQTSLGDATQDTLPGVRRLPNKTVSYLRNSVKATVDAYDGTVNLYAFDGNDPVLKTWMKAFPGTVKPATDISPDLRAHFRYPEDQFKVQRELLTRYHVQNPAEFFSTVSFWDVPSDPTVSGTGPAPDPQPPYYVLAGLPGQQGPSFQLTSALVSLRRPFLSAYVSVSSDPTSYGQMTVLQLPADTQTPGPQQVQNQFVSLPEVSQQLNLLRQNQTTIDYGNLLTLPVAGGLLYVEPIYIERANQESSFPQLARVLVSFGGKIGYDARLDVALNEVFGPGVATGTPPTQAAGGPSQSPAAAGAGQLQAAVTDINGALSRLKAAQQSGDFAAQGAALADLDKAVKRFNSAAGAPAAPATPAPAAPAPAPAPAPPAAPPANGG